MPGQLRAGHFCWAAMISVNARSPAVFSAPNHRARVKASHGSSSVSRVRVWTAITANSSSVSALSSASLVGKWR